MRAAFQTVAIVLCLIGCAKTPDLSAYLGIAPGTAVTVKVAIAVEHRGLPMLTPPPKGMESLGMEFSGPLVSISKDEVVVKIGQGGLPMVFPKHQVVSITIDHP